MLALRCVAPAFALVGGVTVWAMAGPMAAGLALVIFILGVATSELHHLRWSHVDEVVLTAAEFEALADGVAPRAMATAPVTEPDLAAEPEPLIAPKRDFQCTRPELAIGSGRSRLELRERRRSLAARPPISRRRPEPVHAFTPAPRPAPEPTLQAALVPEAAVALVAAANDVPAAAAPALVTPAELAPADTDQAPAADAEQAAAAAAQSAPPQAAVSPAEPMQLTHARTLKFRASYEARLTA